MIGVLLSLSLLATSIPLFWLLVFHWKAWGTGWQETAEIIWCGVFLVFSIYGIVYFIKRIKNGS